MKSRIVKLRRITVAFAAALVGVVNAFCPQSSEATILTFHYSGRVTSITDDPSSFFAGLGFHVGDRMNAVVTMPANLALPDTDPDPNVGFFAPTPSDFNFGFSSPDSDFGTGGPASGTGTVQIENNVAPGDRITLAGDIGDLATFALFFRDPSGKALSTDAWTTRYDPSLWPSITLSTSFLFEDSEPTLTASFATPDTMSTLWLVLPLALITVVYRVMGRVSSS